ENRVAVTIAKRDPSLLPIITNSVTAAITRRFGKRDIHAPIGRLRFGRAFKKSQAHCRTEMPIAALLALWVLILGSKKFIIIGVAPLPPGFASHLAKRRHLPDRSLIVVSARPRRQSTDVTISEPLRSWKDRRAISTR